MNKPKTVPRVFAAFLTYATLVSPYAYAAPQNNGRTFYDMDTNTPAGAIRINLLGGVAAPGRYFIPTKTKLIDLLTIAGGVKDNYDIENIRIKRINKEGYQFVNVNLMETLTEAGSGPVYLQERDTVHIPAIRPLLDKNSSSVISLVTSILSITLTGFVLNDRLSK